MPSPGTILHITEPLGLGVRHDGYVYEGYEIPIYYDPLISKLIVWGIDRDEAIQRMKRALFAYKIMGVKTGIKFLEKIMNTPDFVEGKYNTQFIEKNKDILMEEDKCDGDCKAIATIAAFIDYQNRLKKVKDKIHPDDVNSNWKAFGRKRNITRL
jgi:acetyl-CoA carboxylase biotin carboxylase subunit